ncbi:MAG: GerW family sporulation protein [Clostridiales bacterium]|nr:GerW family sporulation protein [Clostridiales bacterium]
MAETNNNGTNGTFQKTVDSLVKGMDAFVSSKTVVGEPIYIDDTILLPLVDVSFGMGAGAFIAEKKKNSGGGVGAKISPSSVLVIKDGMTRMVSVKNQDNISKILDMIPDFVNKFMTKMEEKKNPEKAEVRKEAREEAAKDLKEKLNIEDE